MPCPALPCTALSPAIGTASAMLRPHFINNKATAIDAAWPVITNTEVIAVNKAWAGHPGAVLTQAKIQVDMWCFAEDRTSNSTCKFPTWQVWCVALRTPPPFRHLDSSPYQ